MTELVTTAESSNDEGPAKKLTRVRVHFKNPAGEPDSLMLKFTANQFIGTLEKKVKQKLKIEKPIKLHHQPNDEELDSKKTATQAGLVDLEELIIVEVEREEEFVVRVVQPDGKIWTQTFNGTDSTTNLYMAYASHTQQTHMQFTLQKSDQNPINRYTTIKDLCLREGEHLIELKGNLAPIEATWLDQQSQEQRKAVYVSTDIMVVAAELFIQYELGLPFPFTLSSAEFSLTSTVLMSVALDDVTNNKLFLTRTEQHQWDDREFNNRPQEMTLTVNINESESINYTATEFFTFMDIAEDIADNHPEYKRNIIQDINGLEYQLDDRPSDFILPGTSMRAKVSSKRKYPLNQVTESLTLLAKELGITTEELKKERFPNITNFAV
jgi:hypothetical protein